MQDGSISIRNLAKSFPAGNPLRRVFRAHSAPAIPVLYDINLEIAAGEIFGLLGPNGAGKTTLVEILATLLLPSGGEARVCGHDVVSEAAKARTLTGYCPSAAENFYPPLDAGENLEVFAL